MLWNIVWPSSSIVDFKVDEKLNTKQISSCYGMLNHLKGKIC